MQELFLSLSGSFSPLFAALNDMEEVAQEDGVAVRESHSEASATNQALLPMEVDEEQAGNYPVRSFPASSVDFI